MDNNRSIEFQEMKKETQQLDVVRKSFRVPVEDDGDIQVKIADQTFQVADINPNGVSILCKDKHTLPVSKTYKNCELRTPEGVIKNLAGKIIHFSSDSDKKWLNGIQWIDLEKESKKKIDALVAGRKERLMKSIHTNT